MENTERYNLADTSIEKGGVLRCCLGTVASEYELHTQVKLGDKSKCKHCKTEFTLVMVKPPLTSCYTPRVLATTPIWKPNWQLKNNS